MLCEQESSVDPGWLGKKCEGKITFRENGGNDGCRILSPNIYLETFGNGTAFLHEKTMFGKDKTTCTYPSQCSEASCSILNRELTISHRQ